MPEDQSYSPPITSRADHAHSLARAGIASVPLVGNAAVELFQVLFAPPLQKRQLEWMESVAEGLRDLEEKERCRIDDLRSNEQFIDTVMKASQAAVRTSQQEKREALRNAVLNSALPHAPDESRQAMFIDWIERLTVWHLRMLRLFADPPNWFADHGRQPPQYMLAGSLSQLLVDAFPELKNQRDFCDKIANDLYNEGLFNTRGLHTVMSGTGPLEKRSTELGNGLLAFISKPRC